MTAYYNEFDPGAAAWLRELIRAGLIADGVVDERSILDVEPADLAGFTQCHFFAGIGGWSYALRLAGWPDDRPVWTGSPPCQPFSAAGKGLGRDDARHLGPHFVGLVRAARPAVLFGEQVASAAVFGKSASSAEQVAHFAAIWEQDRIAGIPREKRRGQQPGAWAWLDDLSDRLEAAHYAVGASDIPAAGIGAPHIRQRTFFGAVRLADAEHSKRWALGQHRKDGCDGSNGGREETHCIAGTRGEVCGLADASISGRGEERQVGGRLCAGDGAQGWTAGLDAGRELGGLADADDARSQGRLGMPERAGECAAGAGSLESGLADAGDSAGQRSEPRATVGGLSSRDGENASVRSADAADSPWGVADWLYCRDGKWRPVEPGTFPLAHGIPARVGRLRGYGNAIVPQAAAEFIRAFEDARADGLRLMSGMAADKGVFE